MITIARMSFYGSPFEAAAAPARSRVTRRVSRGTNSDAAWARSGSLGIQAGQRFRRVRSLPLLGFSEAGWNVVATVRKEADLDVHAGLDNIRTLLLNVDEEDADLGFGDLALSQFGRLDALINNAGYFQGGLLEATTMDQVHRQFQTNVFGLIALNKAVIPIFRKQRSGVIVIVNVSSISTDAGFPYTSVHEASKAAVTSLSEGLHAELAEFGVSVKTLHPGSHETKIFTKVDRAENVPRGVRRFLEHLRLAEPGTLRPGAHRRGDVPHGHRRQHQEGPLLQRPRRRGHPRVKQLLGQDWYLEELNARNRGKATALWNALTPTPTEKG
ncbi:SDR family NAD(P)-dependent oxidoreductase [Streptomyces sp. NPDC058548]|uniref:SDR family NAD(P)-dependent oxidoreductase n=1 Tax=Streptomyces sp. NPDC058548 TaxID=3346545 RepID=UPI003669166E